MRRCLFDFEFISIELMEPLQIRRGIKYPAFYKLTFIMISFSGSYSGKEILQ